METLDRDAVWTKLKHAFQTHGQDTVNSLGLSERVMAARERALFNAEAAFDENRLEDALEHIEQYWSI